MPGFNRNSGGSGGYKGGNSYGTKRPWDRGTQGQGFDDRPKFKATCASCGNACEVPFKPNGSKPVYCRDCFKKEGSDGETRNFQSMDSRGFNTEEKRLYKTSCAKCGDDCEVPFRPTGERPVYCRPCFGKGDAPERSERFERKSAPEFKSVDNNAEQFRVLNAKLDAILKALNPALPAKATPSAKAAEDRPEVKVEMKKEVAPKAPAKKKAAAKKK